MIHLLSLPNVNGKQKSANLIGYANAKHFISFTNSILKNQRAISFLFIANAISGFAQGVSMMAIPFHFARQKQGTTFNFLYGCATFLVLFWGLYAGTLVDRFPRKTVFLGTNLVQGLVIIGVALYGWAFGLTFPLIACVFLITFFGYQIHYPNVYAFAQEISPPAEYKRIISTIEIVGQATYFVSGGAGAILLEGWSWHANMRLLGHSLPIHLTIPHWELHQIFALDGLTYAVSFLLILFIRYVPYRKVEPEIGSVMKRLRSGFSYLWANPLLMLFGLLSFNVFVAASVQLQALLPMYITNHLHQGGQAFGLAELAGSFGAMSAGFLTKKLFANTPAPRALVIVMVLASLGFFVAAFNYVSWLFFLFSMSTGFFNSSARVLRISYLFNYVPNELIGRVNSILSMLNILMRMRFIFLFSHAFFGRGHNITYAYFIMGVFLLISGLLLLVNYRRLMSETKHKPM